MKQIITCIVALFAASSVWGQASSTSSTFPTGTGNTNATFVGIKSTKTDGYKLTVQGAIKVWGTGNTLGAGNFSPTIFFENRTSGTGRKYFIQSNDGGSFRIVDSTAGIVDRLIINSSGNVGIGTSSPSALFHTVGSLRHDLGSDATGDIYYRNASGLFTRLPIGTAGQVLTVSGGLPAWGAAGGGGGGTVTNFIFTNQNGFTGTVTNATTTPTLALSTTLNGLLRGNGTALVTGQVNLASEVTGTLPLANGGTGFTSVAMGDIIYASGTNVLAKLTAGAAGRVLTMGSTGLPEWTVPSGGGGAVSSVFGRTGAVVAQAGDYTFAQIGSTPTTLAGYGITDAIRNGTAVQSGANFNISGNGTLGGNLTVTGTTLQLGSFTQANQVKMNFRQLFNAANYGWDVGYASPTSSDFQILSGESGAAFRLNMNSAERMTVLSNGNVGIGTTSPSYKLDVNGPIRFTNNIVSNNFMWNGDNGFGVWGNLGAPLVNVAYGFVNSWSNTADVMAIKGFAGQTGDYFNILSSAGSKLVTVNSGGNVSIAAATIPSGYKLAVGGNIIAEKVRVKLQSTGWPDYVFQPGYSLPTLKETEQFIKANSHLPGVPSAQQIEKEGLDLGDGQAVLLKKIEEMTLHMIEMNKRLEKLEAENETLKKKQQTL